MKKHWLILVASTILVMAGYIAYLQFGKSRPTFQLIVENKNFRNQLVQRFMTKATGEAGLVSSPIKNTVDQMTSAHNFVFLYSSERITKNGPDFSTCDLLSQHPNAVLVYEFFDHNSRLQKNSTGQRSKSTLSNLMKSLNKGDALSKNLNRLFLPGKTQPPLILYFEKKSNFSPVSAYFETSEGKGTLLDYLFESLTKFEYPSGSSVTWQRVMEGVNDALARDKIGWKIKAARSCEELRNIINKYKTPKPIPPVPPLDRRPREEYKKLELIKGILYQQEIRFPENEPTEVWDKVYIDACDRWIRLRAIETAQQLFESYSDNLTFLFDQFTQPGDRIAYNMIGDITARHFVSENSPITIWNVGDEPFQRTIGEYLSGLRRITDTSNQKGWYQDVDICIDPASIAAKNEVITLNSDGTYEVKVYFTQYFFGTGKGKDFYNDKSTKVATLLYTIEDCKIRSARIKEITVESAPIYLSKKPEGICQ